ncbi:two-component sensor histidine kinase [Clostridium sp. CAG:628]|nr:two-component sensor histidine kinase [Clostridium sp. CAG:628]
MELIISAILVTFPLLIYDYFVIYSQNMKMKKRSIVLKLILYSSLYLAMFYTKNIPFNYRFVSIIIPLILTYLYKEKFTSIVINIIIINYTINYLNYNMISTFMLFFLLYLSFNKYIKSNKNDNIFINNTIILLAMFQIANTIMNYSKMFLIDNIHSFIIFTIIIKILNYFLSESKNVINLHMNLKEFEKDKNMKINLFKITHEIKNPLAVIKGYLSMFDVNNKEKSTKYIKIIKSEVNRSLNLLSDFMEFTKIKINTSNVIFNDLMDDIKEVLIPFFNAKNVKYNFNIEANIEINIDYNRIKQVLINVIKNAVEACPNNMGLVSTTIFKDKDYLYIFVKDNGSGMDKDTLDNILVPFFTTKENGTGLGVSLSKEIILSHKGEISYDSILGKGTTCKITLPLN